MNKLIDKWAQNGSVKIHYITNQPNNSIDRTGIVFSLGIWEPAERAIPLLNSLKDRRGVAFSYRGRGKSDTPKEGYDLDSHISDLEAVIEEADMDKFCLLGFSRGVQYALGYALKHPEKLTGLILVDFPPFQTKPSAKFWIELVYLGRPLTDFTRPEAFEGMERESIVADFTKQLNKITCPVIIFRGVQDTNSIPSNLSENDLKLYFDNMTNVREVQFHNSGHMIPDDETELYINTVNDFLEQLDIDKLRNR